MKVIFLLLVLANLAYLGWQTWIVPEQAPPVLIEAEGVPQLVLVGEDPDDPAYVPPEKRDRVVMPAVAVAEQPEQAEPEPEPAVPASEPVVEPVEDPVEAPAEIEVAVAPAAGLRCVSLGPFINLREATEATAMLIEAGLEPRQRLAESQVWFGHWVHLPPQPSREAAIAIVEDLRAKGVSDIYIEPSGPLRNSISLGVFSDRSHAETLAGQIRRLGISPQIRDRYRDSSVYWVDFALPQGQVIDASAYQASPRRVLRIEGIDCPEEG